MLAHARIDITHARTHARVRACVRGSVFHLWPRQRRALQRIKLTFYPRARLPCGPRTTENVLIARVQS